MSTFLEEMESLELKKFNNTVLVRLNFKVKEYGYSTLSKFIAGIKCLKITATDENRRMVSIK